MNSFPPPARARARCHLTLVPVLNGLPQRKAQHHGTAAYQAPPCPMASSAACEAGTAEGTWNSPNLFAT
eukprot:292286-Pleurochrysis_carterae.AAC.1